MNAGTNLIQKFKNLGSVKRKKLPTPDIDGSQQFEVYTPIFVLSKFTINNLNAP